MSFKSTSFFFLNSSSYHQIKYINTVNKIPSYNYHKYIHVSANFDILMLNFIINYDGMNLGQ